LALGYAFGHSIQFIAEISADVNGILVSFGVIVAVLWYAHHWAKRRGQLSHKT
jgi:membrane protein DedA with SNARE-associated domain